MFDRHRSQAFSTSVWDGHCRLEQEQALFRSDHVNASLVPVTDDGVVVGVRVEAKHRQFESALAVLRGMAGSHVAASLREDRRNVADKFCGRIFLDAGYDNASFNQLVTNFDGQLCLSVRDAEQLAVLVNCDDRRVSSGVGSVGGQVCRGVSYFERCVGLSDDELNAFKVTVEADDAGGNGKWLGSGRQ